MKKIIFSGLVFTLLLSTAFAQYSTERTGYEGDYFSLEGALDLFKESSTLRDFERKLNTERNWVNNLDLNYDGRIDYIRVEHRRQGDFHAIILQAIVDRYDVQDVAVIELEIIRRGDAVLQIIGDEDLYGEEVYVEPVEGYSDSRRGYNSDYGDYVNVYYWRPVQYLLGRQYRVYVSPYRWRYYPTWWNPWVQVSWNVFRPRIVVYVNRYHVVRRHRVIRVHNFYRPYRSYCNTVVQRANRVRVRYGREPIYRPEPRRGRGNDNYRDRNYNSDRQQPISRSTSPRRDAPLSRNRAISSPDRDINRSRNQGGDQRTRSSANRSENPRSIDRSSTTRQSPSVSRKRTAPASSPNISRSRNQGDDQRIRSSGNRSGENPRSIDRSSTPRSNPSVSRKRTAPTSRSDVNRSRSSQLNQRSARTPSRADKSSGKRNIPSAAPKTTRKAPSRTYERSNNNSSRSRASTRSTTPSRKPSASKGRSLPSAKPKASGKTDSKRSSSRSRRGGGEPEA